MMDLQDLKKRATASEAVLIERVEALVAEQAKTDAVTRLKAAIHAVGVPSLNRYDLSPLGENPIRAWVDKISAKLEET